MQGKLVQIATLLCFFLGFHASGSQAPGGENCEALMEPAAHATPKIPSWAGQIVILDTNVLLNDPLSFQKFPGAKVVVPFTVLEEMDDKKHDARLGSASRTFSRELIQLISKTPHGEELSLPGGGLLHLDDQDYLSLLSNKTLSRDKKDNEILAAAMAYNKDPANDGRVWLITDDFNLRIKAYSFGVEAKPSEFRPAAMEAEPAAQLREFEVSDEDLEVFVRDGRLPKPEDWKIPPNQFVQLRSPSYEGSEATVGRYIYDREVPEQSRIQKLPLFEELGLPFMPRNLEQAMALDLLLDPTVEVVIMQAKAGTGKTFLAMMSALNQMQKGLYGRVWLTRASVHVGGKDPGALKGDAREKNLEWEKAFLDNLNVLHLGKDGSRDKKPGHSVKTTLPGGWEFLPLEWVRGRSLDHALILFDEVQNTSEHQVKTVMTRAAKGTKIVLMGDVTQIDAPTYLNKDNNGLTVARLRLTRSDLAPEAHSRVGSVILYDGVRSPLSELVADSFDKPLPE